MTNEYVRKVADTLIEQLKQGSAPWIKPWEPGKHFFPYNPSTGNKYHGMNVLWLMARAQVKNYNDQRWLTYRQAQEMGAQVRKGEKGTSIQYWQWRREEQLFDADGTPAKDKEGKLLKETIALEKPRVFFAVVFNADQVEGLLQEEASITLPAWERHERAENILLAGGLKIEYQPGDRCYYSPRDDKIVLVDKAQFATTDRFYATALHEKAHWTGHSSRLDRDIKHPFGSQLYAREELRAEIASLMLGDELGIGHDPGQHVAYIHSWIKILEDHPNELFRAAADAEKISSFLFELEMKHEHEIVSSQSVVDEQQKEKIHVATGDGAVDIDNIEKLHLLPTLSGTKDQIEKAKEIRENYFIELNDLEKRSQLVLDKMAKFTIDPNNPLKKDVQDTYTKEISRIQNLREKTDAGWWIINQELPVGTLLAKAEEPTYLTVPYAEKESAKLLGARWDKEKKSWYVPYNVDIKPFKQWMDNRVNPVIAEITVIEEFGVALSEAGIIMTDTPIMDGELHRVPVNGDKSGARSGAYIGFTDGHPAGYIKNYITGFESNWKSTTRTSVLGDKDRIRLSEEAIKRQAMRADEREHKCEQAAINATTKWQTANIAEDDHPYLTAKKIKAYGLKVDNAGNLAIPLHDNLGKIWSLQTITPEGKKAFQKDGKVHGHYFMIGNTTGQNRFLVAEGFSTAATLHEATGIPVAVAFSAGNLTPVAQSIKEKFRQANIYIAADNDHQKERLGLPNVGREKAEEAAKAINTMVLLPQFNEEEKGTDWNDLAALSSVGYVKWSVNNAIKCAERQLTQKTNHDSLVLKRDNIKIGY